MTTFKTRLSQVSKTNGKVILANDYDSSEKNLQNKTIQNIKKLNPYLCGIKLNFHLLHNCSTCFNLSTEKSIVLIFV